MEQKPPSEPKVAWEKEEEEGPGAAPAQQPGEVEQVQPLQECTDQTQEQDRAPGCWHFIGQMFQNLKGTRRRGIDTMQTEGAAKTHPMPTQDLPSAPSPDLFGMRVVSHASEVPAFVRNMYLSLVSSVVPDDRFFMDLLRLSQEHPADVAVTLLCCAPSCDRAAAIMWRTIASSGMAMEKVLPTLLCVMEDWPKHRMSTSDGELKDVFALAASRVVWEILHLPWCPEPFRVSSPRLLLALLFQVFFSTEQVSEEVDNFWRECRKDDRLPTSINSFAVQTIRALLHHLRCLDLLMAMERKRGWDTLLCADTHHYAMGVLAREMRRVSSPLCSGIALHLLTLLRGREPRWDLPALAFLVEVFPCLDLTECGHRVLKVMSRYLQSECRERRRLALRGLVVLSKDPSMARRMCRLSQNLLELLGDADGDVVGMTLSVFRNMLQNKDILVSSTTAPKLAEALLPLFEHDNSRVQLLSIHLFCMVMELVVEEAKQPLKTIVSQSLLPLFFHCHNENRPVAEASWATLLCVAGFLKTRGLKQLVKKNQLWKFGEHLLAKDRSRAAEHLRHALPYLDSPQESLREAAVRFIGIAGVLMMGQKEELQVLSEALQALSIDDNPSHTNVVVQHIFNRRAAELCSSAH